MCALTLFKTTLRTVASVIQAEKWEFERSVRRGPGIEGETGESGKAANVEKGEKWESGKDGKVGKWEKWESGKVWKRGIGRKREQGDREKGG